MTRGHLGQTILCLLLGLGLAAGCSDDTEVKSDSALPDLTQTDSPSSSDQTVDLPGTVDRGPDLPAPPGTWVQIKPGSFTMGSPASEPCREPGKPKETAHQVTLTYAFEMLATEVTQGQFDTLMGSQSAHSCPNCPVTGASWHQAAAYCNALSSGQLLETCYDCSGTGVDVTCTEAAAHVANITKCKGYRLPTEAEWEYAYRAGTQTAYYNGANDYAACMTCTVTDANLDKIAWYKCNVPTNAVQEVGQKQPNTWGLYDMAGNAWEWTNDWFRIDLGTGAVQDPTGPTKSHASITTVPGVPCRVTRSGGLGPASLIRAANRGWGPPSVHAEAFRVVRTK